MEELYSLSDLSSRGESQFLRSQLVIKADLKFSIQKMKIMASSPITSWQIEGEETGGSVRFNFLGFQNHCRW